MLGFIKLGYMITDTQNRLVGAKGEEVRRDGISKCKLLVYRDYKIYQAKRLRKQFYLPSQQKRIKYLGIKLPKEATYLYSENCNILMKEIKDNTNR